MKKKVFLFFLAALPLVGVPAFSSALEQAPLGVEAAASYLDVASGLTSLTYESFYLFGAYAEENGSPFMYLMAFPGYGSFVRVPCLAKTDASHPCGLLESDFSANCLSAVMLAHRYAASSTDISFSFIYTISELYADPTTHAFVGSIGSGTNVSPNVTFDQTASPESCTLSGWEYQIANQAATFQGFTTSVDSGYSTTLYAYPVAESLIRATTAVGFASGLNGGVFSKDEAVSTYQGLARSQRELFAYYRNGYKTDPVATQAVETILQNGVTSYKKLWGLSDDSGTGIYASATPTPKVDYASDSITGLLDGETYEIDYGNSGAQLFGSPTEGAIAFAGSLNNTLYDLAGETAISINVYNNSSLGGGDIASAKVALNITARLAAPSSRAVVLASLPVSPSENTTGLYDDQISATPEEGVQYAIAPTETSMDLNELAYLSWKDTPTFSNLTPETSYTVYKRTHSLTASDSLPIYDSANGVYLGQAFTTLSELEGAKKKALIANDQAYEQTLAQLAEPSEHAALLSLLMEYKSKIEAVTSLTDLSSLNTESYRKQAFAFALFQDQTVQSLKENVSLLASDSSASQNAYQSAVLSIQALNFFAGDDSLSAQNLADECLAKVASFRYRESQGKALVSFFNDSIVPGFPKLSAENQEKLWNAFDGAFQQIMTSLGSDLTTTKGMVDALYTSACSSLTSLLKELSA